MKIKPKKIFNTIIFVLFTLYISFYIASVSGYYEYEKKEETTLTNEKMKEFEKDLKEGKKVDIKKYLTDNTKKYDNKCQLLVFVAIISVYFEYLVVLKKRLK